MLNTSNLIDRIRLPFRKEKELFSAIYEMTGFYPRNIEYYQLALMHKSASRRNAKGRPLNNERLEFLGDAILDAVIGDVVYHHFPGKREGFLTNTRAKIVSRDTLNRLAKEMRLDDKIKTGGRVDHRHNNYMGGNAFEAFVGALYLDHGYDACKKFLEKHVIGELINIDRLAYKEVNFKSRMIEWGQKYKRDVVFDTIEQRKEKDGSPVFHTTVIIKGIRCGEGIGYSKKESHQEASHSTLKRIKHDPKFLDMLLSEE